MKDAVATTDFHAAARRLTRCRIPLVLAIVVNSLLIARVPLAQWRASGAEGAPNGERPARQEEAREPNTGAGTHRAPGAAAAGGEHAAPTVAVDSRNGPRTEGDPGNTEGVADTRALAPGDRAVAGPNDHELPAAGVGTAEPTVSPLQLAGQLASHPRVKHVASRWRVQLEGAFRQWQTEFAVREPASAAPHSGGHESAASEPGAQRPIPTPPSGDDQQPAHAAQLVVRNPADNGGTVHFLIGQEVVSLLPGETRHFSGDAEWLLRFHRGDAFDNVATVLPPGLYQFVVDREGWRLTPVTAPLASGVTP